MMQALLKLLLIRLKKKPTRQNKLQKKLKNMQTKQAKQKLLEIMIKLKQK